MRLAFIFVFLACLFTGSASADEILDQAKQFLAQGKAAEAYTLLAPLEAARTGDGEFNYILGAAAAGSGKPAQAFTAFQRVLAIDPKYPGAQEGLEHALNLSRGKLEEGKRLMGQGKASEAFALLDPLEPQFSGDVEFDYTFATAALDAGKFDRATIALERVLAINPNFAGARLDLARAYFAMGSDDLAKTEFDAVMQENPPANVRPIIVKYLEAIEVRKKKEKPAAVGYVEVSGGTDSNITAVTNNFTGAVLQAYNIPSVQPTGNSVPRSGAFSQAAAGGDFSVPMQSGISWYAGGDAKDRHYYQNNAQFNIQQYDWRAGVAYTPGEDDLLKGGVQGQNYYQEGAAPRSTVTGTAVTNDRKTFGYTTEWRHALGPGERFGLFAQFNQQRFPTNQPQDINQYLYGGQFIKAWEAKGNPLLMLACYQSRDRALGPLNIAGTTDASKTLTGARVYGQVSPLEALDVFVSVGNTDRRDNSQFARSTVVAYGHDQTFDATLGTNIRIASGWSLRAQGTYFENRSNIALYEYKRREVSLALRYDFK